MTSRPEIRFLDRSTPPHIMTLVLIAGLAALSLNIFLPSLPSMELFFETEYWIMQLSVSLYLAMTAVLQIIIGPLSDRFGRRPVLLFTIFLFILATIGALLATSITVFLACRIAQAAIASGFALSRAIVRDMVGQDEAASMIGYVTMGMSIVPMVGPMIGGKLDEVFGWQASFVLLLICACAVFVLVWRDLGETAQSRPTGFRAQFREYPELLTAQRFWGYCLAAAFASGAFFAFLGGAPFVGKEVFNLSPSVLGFYFGAPALGYAVGNYLSGRYSMRFGVNRMVLAGTLVTTTGLAILALITYATEPGPLVFFGMITSVGLGNGMALPSANAGMLSVRPHLAGTASGLGGAIMIGGGAALSALAGRALVEGSGALPLVLIMALSSFASILAIWWVIRRARALALA